MKRLLFVPLTLSAISLITNTRWWGILGLLVAIGVMLIVMWHAWGLEHWKKERPPVKNEEPRVIPLSSRLSHRTSVYDWAADPGYRYYGAKK